jgi:hypothetical protein
MRCRKDSGDWPSRRTGALHAKTFLRARGSDEADDEEDAEE